MAVPATSINSATATAQIVENAQWYSTVVIENGSTVAVFVRLDGTAATDDGAGCTQVPAGQTQAFPNQQPQPNANGNGGVPLKFGFTTQQNNMPYTNVGFPTYASLIVQAAGTGYITVAFQ